MAKLFVKKSDYDKAVRLARAAIHCDWIGDDDDSQAHKTDVMKSIEDEIEKLEQ